MNPTEDGAGIADTELEVAALIVEALMLEDVDPMGLDGATPLFTDDKGEGLGLDSIDVLELAMALNKRYGIKIKADDEANRSVFETIASLAAFVDTERSK